MNMRPIRFRKRTNRIILYTVLVIYAVLILFPMLIVLLPTFQTVQESSRGILTVPSQLNLYNYIKAWNQSKFPNALKNSLIITVSTIVINILIGSVAAFPMAIRENNRIFKTAFYIFLVGLMLPFQAIMIPLYVLMGRTLKLTNTYIGTILVYVAMTLPITVFFFSQFIKTIPKEMEEASVIDGCGYLRMFFRIFFPLLKPITSAVIIQNMIFLWNDLLVPLILIDKTQLKPVMPKVYMFFGQYYNQWNLAFSVLVLAAIPFLLLFLLLQEQFIRGLSAGAVKG
ncbi:MAG TPA: carbohydrate ABC transporter permease [Spirochaetia bacterium]|nr:carbohydrate ABC transporter permease [Spirochaetia bacterium]